MLKALCNAFGVSGCEDEVRKLILAEISDYCDSIETDSMGNLICFKKGSSIYRNKIMLTAHMDEVGLIVTDVTKDGHLRFKTVGGVDARVLIGKRVIVNKTVGVIGDIPPHLNDGKSENAAKIKDLYIDIGAKDEEEAKKYVSLGDYAVFDSEYVEFGNRLIKAKALDDRIGCDILIQLAKNSYPNDIYFVFTVQEEVGCRGAAIAAYSVKPDIAVVVEATTCSDVAGTSEEGFATKLRHGAALSIMDGGSYSDASLRKELYSTAIENDIKVQFKQTSFGGNDAAAIHLSQTGVKTAVVSVPCRYIHSASCVACIDDIQSCRDILDKFLVKERAEWSF